MPDYAANSSFGKGEIKNLHHFTGTVIFFPKRLL